MIQVIIIDIDLKFLNNLFCTNCHHQVLWCCHYRPYHPYWFIKTIVLTLWAPPLIPLDPVHNACSCDLIWGSILVSVLLHQAHCHTDVMLCHIIFGVSCDTVVRPDLIPTHNSMHCVPYQKGSVYAGSKLNQRLWCNDLLSRSSS